MIFWGKEGEFRSTYYGSSHWALAPRAGVVAQAIPEGDEGGEFEGGSSSVTVQLGGPRRPDPMHRHHVCCFAPGCGTAPFSVPGPGLPGGRPGGLPGGHLGVDFGSRREYFDLFPGLEVMIFHLRCSMTAPRGITAVKAKVSLSLCLSPSLSLSLSLTTHRLRAAQRTPDRIKPKRSFRWMLLR